MSKLSQDKDSKSTKKATKWSQSILKAYQQEKNSLIQLQRRTWRGFHENITPQGERRMKTCINSKTSLFAIRCGLNRHFNQVLNVDIIKDKELNKANRVYEA